MTEGFHISLYSIFAIVLNGPEVLDTMNRGQSSSNVSFDQYESTNSWQRLLQVCFGQHSNKLLRCRLSHLKLLVSELSGVAGTLCLKGPQKLWLGE